MKKLQIFSNNEFGEIRTLVLNNEPWFVGKDVIFYYKKLQVPSSSQQNSLKISRQATELKRLVFVRIFLFCPVGSKITYFALAAVACCCAIITGSVGS